MIQAQDFILNSEIATLKNDSSGTVFTVTIPSGLTFNPSSPIIGTETKEVGTINAGLRSVATTTKFSGTSVGNVLISQMDMNISGFGVQPVTTYSSLQRISPTQLSLVVQVETVSGAPNHTTMESQTIQFTVSTFLSPLD